MSAILYPVAASAEEALRAPRGRAARERDAERLAGEAVRFASEETGPPFASRAAAFEAFRGKLEDDADGGPLPPEDRFCQLRERIETSAPEPIEPEMKDGRRWPRRPNRRVKTTYRVTVSYWKIGGAPETLPDVVPEAVRGPQARDLRRKTGAAGLEPRQLRALAEQPLRPVRPQQPLDIGLFEAPAPEAPHILIPDE